MNFFVYGLIDPTNDELRYVGCTIQSLDARLRRHLWPSGRRSNTHKNHWLNKLIANGLRPRICCLMLCSSPSAMYEIERFYIALLRCMGARLVNASDGGVGRSAGYVASDATRRKMSRTRIGRAVPDTQRELISRSLGGTPLIDGNGTLYASVSEAARQLRCKRSAIHRALQNEGRFAALNLRRLNTVQMSA